MHIFRRIINRLRLLPYGIFYSFYFCFVCLSLKSNSFFCNLFARRISATHSSLCLMYDLSFFPPTWDFPDFLAIAEAFAAAFDLEISSVCLIYDSTKFKLPTFAGYSDLMSPENYLQSRISTIFETCISHWDNKYKFVTFDASTPDFSSSLSSLCADSLIYPPLYFSWPQQLFPINDPFWLESIFQLSILGHYHDFSRISKVSCEDFSVFETEHLCCSGESLWIYHIRDYVFMPERNTPLLWLEELDSLLEANGINLIVIPDFYNPEVDLNVRFVERKAATNNSLRFYYNSIATLILGDSSGHVQAGKYFSNSKSISIVPESIASGRGPQTGSHRDLKRLFHLDNVYEKQPLHSLSLYFAPRLSPHDFYRFAQNIISC